MSTQHNDSTFDPDEPHLTRFDLVREGARRDGVEIVHYEPRFAKAGTAAEKRVERTIAFWFMITGLAALAFVVVYVAWPWEYEFGGHLDKWYTPMLGATLGLALFGLGAAQIIWAKRLLPAEVSVQERHDDVDTVEQKLTGATLVNMGQELNVSRRPLLKGAIALGALPLGAAAVVPLGGMIVDPHGHGDPLFHTGFDAKQFNEGKPVRLVREDGTPIRPEDVSVGGQITAFPGVPHGTTNVHADSPTLLIHLRDNDAKLTRENLGRVEVNKGGMWQNFVAYSKICTHLGCPASLYEQQTNRLLCPCHQSQFLITDNAKPIFGPATRRLPMLPIGVDDEGFFYATSDYKVPVGAAFWERP
ncbi:ubiquinol-cytochrome c reductase iron-sulfur subunit [Longispora albida]|uniref:cytochrome bc1 complex Rieske iron-sulfur subunit n=1 Tax=Longispora albida TaxID=203523 RepID=UPI0003705AB6|nr:Rieske 2Fe-2S domain-containing protein [Longispora albida]